jgi:hypothetical protein
VNGHDLNGAAPQVIITSNENPAAQVRLHSCRFPGEYETTFAVDLHADGLDAGIGEVSVTPWDNGGLTGFMDGLAADFRGWAGTRTWFVNHLKITADFHSRGHVELCWTIRPWITRLDWETSLITWIESGQVVIQLQVLIAGRDQPRMHGSQPRGVEDTQLAGRQHHPDPRSDQPGRHRIPAFAHADRTGPPAATRRPRSRTARAEAAATGSARRRNLPRW